MDDIPKYVNVRIDAEQLRYIKKMQELLCARLDMELPKEYDIPDITVEQAIFAYIDLMESHYRLDGEEWEEFYHKWSGVSDVPRTLEDYKERE